MRFFVFVMVMLCVSASVQAAEIIDLRINSKDTGQVHSFDVELALTAEEHVQGLMFREEMPEDAGMLFVFNESRELGFWMRNTLIPLDILYIIETGEIVSIHENAVPHDLTQLRSGVFASRALEVNGGTIERLGIELGDVVVNQTYFRPKAEAE